jgi:cytochrome c oxidase cbb3-type subunit 3
MPQGFLRLSLLVALFIVLRALTPAWLYAQRCGTPPPAASSGPVEGQRIFATSCAACHGLDARGGERGPDIATKIEVQQLSDDALLHLIQDGVAGTGMPAFRALGTAQIRAVVSHLRSLQGQATATQLPGDPERGKELFFGGAPARKPGCSKCHMANGEGGFIGPDLSSYAGARSADEIRSMITDPDKNLDPRKRPVVVTTVNGKKQTGLVRNEDNFSMQLQAPDGTFHLFAKAKLRSIEYQARSLMPADYGTRLSRQELDDLVSYVMTIARTDSKQTAGKE